MRRGDSDEGAADELADGPATRREGSTITVVSTGLEKKIMYRQKNIFNNNRKNIGSLVNGNNSA